MIRRILLVLFVSGFFVSDGLSQEIVAADTVLANRYYSIADSLFKINSYIESIEYAEKAKSIYSELNLLEKKYDSELKIISILMDKRDFVQAENRVKELLPSIQSQFTKDHYLEGKAYFRLGSICFRKNSLNLAVEYLNKSLVIFNKSDSAKIYSLNGDALSNLAGSYYYMGDYDKAIELSIRAMEIRKSLIDADPVRVASSYSNIGIVNSNLGQYDIAMQYFLKGLTLLKDSSRRSLITYAGMLRNIAGVKIAMGEFNTAKEYLFQSLNHYVNVYGIHNQQLVVTYENLGATFYYTGDYDSSLYYYNKAFEEHNIAYVDQPHKELGLIYSGIARNYLRKGDYNKAIDLQMKSNALLEEINYQGVDIFKGYTSLGLMYDDKKEYDTAIYYYKMGINLYLKRFKKPEEAMADPYRFLSIIEMNRGNYEEALLYSQNGITCNLDSFSYNTVYDNPPKDGYLNQLLYLKSLTQRADIFKNKFEDENNIKDLIESIETYELCDGLLNEIRSSHQSYNDKIQFQSQYVLVYQGAIETMLLAYEEFKDDIYLEKYFYYTERNKAGILTGYLSDNKAKTIGNIPPSILKLEANTKSKVSFYQNKLSKERHRSNRSDSLKILVYAKKTFDFNNQHDSLIKVLESNYPEYYRMKYENKVIGLSNLQQKLSENAAVLEYFQGDSTLYVMTITKNDFKVSVIENTNPINQNIDQLREVISIPTGTDQVNLTQSKYVSSAYELYNDLMKESLYGLSEDIDNLIVIPDGKLSYIPFELLISDSTASNDYSALNYLIKDYNISYAYSATLQYQDRLHLNRKETENSYLGFAPSYEDSDKDSTRLLALGKFRDAATSLVWNQKEVEEATEYMNGDNWLALNATETSFKQEVGKYNIVHLAMHAFIDDEDPMLSKLVFAQDKKDTLNDGFLHTYELFNMEMNPDLVVLSACNTGYGKLEKGEGINSLAYAFAYAGCPSIVMSQWQVNDKSTSELMIHFYKNISEGMDKSAALRQAKLEFLKKPGSPYANPSYWGGFVLIGDTQPIELDQYSYRQILLFALIIMFVMILSYMKFRRT